MTSSYPDFSKQKHLNRQTVGKALDRPEGDLSHPLLSAYEGCPSGLRCRQRRGGPLQGVELALASQIAILPHTCHLEAAWHHWLQPWTTRG
jgi:hypothetical protein